MLCYIYIQSEKDPPLYSVGFYRRERWIPESDHPTAGEAAERVHWLNGGNPDPEPDLLTCPVGLALSPDARALVVCEDGSVWTGPGGQPASLEWEECEPIPGTARFQELAPGELEDPDCDQFDLEEEIEQMGSALDDDLDAGELEDLETNYQGGEV